MKPEDEPYALNSPDEMVRRAALLNQPHMAPLAQYLASIKAKHPEKELPAFDPCDGGVGAKALFLLEAPGPKAVGSTFISRNNPDPTARNLCELLREVNIARAETLIWNIVPWYVGDGAKIRAVNANDIRESFPHLGDLIGLLPDLKVIMLLGKKAQSAKNQIAQLTNVPIIETSHPSARVFNVWPDKKEEVRKQLKQVAALL